MFITVLVLCFVFGSRIEDACSSYVSPSKLGKFEKAAVSTDCEACAPICKDILKRNGSAVDAAIALLVCIGANNPESSGLGGGFLMLYYNRTEGEAYFIDARETAPRRATQDMFKGNATMATVGPLSIAVPGELAGYSIAHRWFGRLKWKELFTPTIEMCRKGIKVGHHLAGSINSERKLMMNKDIGQVFLKNGTSVYKAGEYIKRPALANTLETIANQGKKALYGPSKLADDFLSDLKAAGSIIDREDMQGYKPRLRQPVRVNLRKNTTMYSVSTPGSGALLAFIMAVIHKCPAIDKYMTKDKTITALAYHRMIETFKYALAQRGRLEDEDESKTTETKKIIEKLTSPAYVAKIRKRISDSSTYNTASHYGAHFSLKEDYGTAHLSLVAPDGDAVSVTTSIGHFFGSKILSKSTGVVLNDHMYSFSSRGTNSSKGFTSTTKNSIRPGMRPMSSMCPMILLDSDGKVRIVLGASGGSLIRSTVTQVAARILFYNQDIKSSIDAPRIHHQLKPNILFYENGFPQAMLKELKKFGHKSKPYKRSMSSVVTGVVRGDDGYLYTNSDYRKGGNVDGF